MSDDDRIFVSVAAYRDPDLPNTVRSAISHAGRPDRLRFGICHQHDDETVADLEPWDDDPRVYVDAVDHRRANGVGWARARIQALWDHEPWYLQIDAHTRFEPDWDRRCIAMAEATGAERPVVTNYPRFFVPLPGDGEMREALAYPRRLGLEPSRRPGSMRQRSEPADADADCPGRHPFVAAGHLFTLGRFVRDVPYDPDIYYRGEEISLAVRAFTHGYDLFWPNENLLWHWYDHAAPLHWDHDATAQRRQRHTDERVTRLLCGQDAAMGRFGLGRRRTVDQYEAMSGVDLSTEWRP